MSLKKRLVHATTGGRISLDSRRVTQVTALDDVSLSLGDGDAVGITGHNGAGKTTLLRTIAGIYPPSQGVVTTTGRIGTLIELGAGVDGDLTGYENIVRLGMLLGMGRRQIIDLIPAIEEFTELGDFLQVPVRTYSSGMLVRLLFAVNTAQQPDILLVDEMFGAGDAAFQDKARARMTQLIAAARIFVLVSHSETLVRSVCRRLFNMTHGTLIEVNAATAQVS